MSNGKVRIYELSRELNLDNKDILNICEGLNIAVKSHSSTITESDAERIRAAAEKYPNRPAPIGGRERAAYSQASSGSQSTSTGRSNGQRRQQFVELRKPKPRHTSNSSQEATPSVTPPKPPVKPAAVSPKKPVVPDEPSQESQDNGDKPTLLSKPEPKVSSPDPSSHEASEKTGEASEKAQLVSPPVRPAPPKPKSNKSSVPPPVKPAKPNTSVAQSGGTQAPSKPVSKDPKPVSAELDSPRPTPAPPVPKLQEPPVRRRDKEQADELVKSKSDDDSSDEDDSVETTELLEIKLKRPTAPRTPKKKARYEEINGEQEGKDTKSKVGKTKNRREIFLDEDEEEDLQAELNAAGTAVNVSLSIARPPKPKSAKGQASSAPTAKPNINRDRRSGQSKESKDSRNKRRAKEGVQELAELIVLKDSLTIRELADALNIAETEIIRKLFFKGIAVSITQTLDVPTAKMVAEELGVVVETPEEQSQATKETEWLDEADLEKLVRRPPVVTIMGHVDHGKTTLLDAIRSTKVAQGEAGGITQHIGAYHVDVEHEDQMQQVVFLDTPGHEAFTAMRARGARVTDIAILVVAADDGVRPQTIEAISHAKAAGVPMVIAINKIDKEGASPDRVKQELTEYGLVPEEWGGETIMVPVSAIQQENLDTLLEMILLVAEIEDLQANPERPAKGTVIEANLDKARGPLATLLVQNGTLRVGDTLVAGSIFGKVRAMIDDRGEQVENATPSFAVEVLGLSNVPAAGDEFEVFKSEKEARSVADQRSDEQRQSRLQQVMASRRVSLSSLSAQAQEGELKELNLILKADVQGSVEAILGSLKQLPQNEVQLRVLLTAAGEISETDIDLAAASGAVIIGFNTGPSHSARVAAEREGVDVREYSIIYQLLDDIQGAMEGLLEPEEVEEHLGEVEVRAVFSIGRGAVAGCYVLSGQAVRNCRIRVNRGGKIVYEGILDSLKRVKDDVREVKSGFECGIGVDNFSSWEVGDIIETYKMVTKRRTLSAK